MTDALRRSAPLVGLLGLPALALVAAHLPDFGGATLPVSAVFGILGLIASLAFAATARPPRAVAIGALVLGGAWTVFAYFAHGVTLTSVLLGEIGLLCAGHVVGAAIGHRVEHAGHMLPATAMAIAADVASVVSPEGPSRAIASDEASLRALVVGFPLPGGEGFTFLVGLGDVVFIALLLAVAVRHGVSILRVALATLGGWLLALGAAAWLAAPVPALVGIGLVAVVSVPAFRKVRPRERNLTVGACLFAVVVVAAVVGRAVLARRPANEPSAPSADPTAQARLPNGDLAAAEREW